ncbi:hypothetical protein [Croceitalea sp. MTPC5]|uniref:hypothetical protein n=1 Tax=Croceitalea sp. MTPC5 TaxID=3056565 RepID=UPI0030CE304C
MNLFSIFRMRKGHFQAVIPANVEIHSSYFVLDSASTPESSYLAGGRVRSGE